MIGLKVNASKSYEVLIGDGLINSVVELVSPVCKSKKVAVITDDIVDSLYGRVVLNSLSKAGFAVSKMVFKNGEGSKNVATLSDIWEFLAENSFTRSDMLVALGGGVVGDMTGFVAATYMRGVNFVQIPTTLLAAVDASIGGKTAIDLVHGKNLAGAFWQPSLVICDCDILRKLPKNLFNDGMAEVIKHGILRDETILECVERGAILDELEQIIEKNLMIKSWYVEEDEHDYGIRQQLNFGHTVGHAIEKISNFTLSHGQAVAYGMIIESRIANRMGICSNEALERIERVVKPILSEMNCYDASQIVVLMRTDKKSDADNVHIILPKRIGDCASYTFSYKQMEDLLSHINTALCF